MARWQALNDHVFLFPDCCNVYALCDGRRAILFDLGSGAALDSLGDIAVEQVQAVYFTHAHRDQCQGWAKAARRGIPLHFPQAAESFVSAQKRLDFKLPHPGHLRYPGRFRPPQPIPAARFDVTPRAAFSWGPFHIQAFAAPGHIDHQLAYRVDGPGGPYLFSGDALHSPGKLHEPFNLETMHYASEGTRQAISTLLDLRQLRAEVLCPSHGPITRGELWEAFDKTIALLRRMVDLRDTIMPRRPAAQRLVRPQRNKMLRISEHLWLWNNSYFLLSDDGPVLMVDVQTKLPNSFHELYRQTFGDRPIEVVLVSHMHCDHVMGIEDLRRHQPLRCWAHEILVGPITNPYAYARPYVHNCPTHVDRVLREGETVRWHEYEITAFWFPGQTDFHAVYELEVDGHHALFSGDNFYPPQQWGGTGGLCGFNGGHPALWRKSAQFVLERSPEWILASHMQPFLFRRDDFQAVVRWSREVEELMRELAPDGNIERHHSPHFIEPRPYVQPAAPEMSVQLLLKNTYPDPLTLTIIARPLEPIRCPKSMRRLTLAPGERGTLSFALRAPQGLRGMHMVTFDVSTSRGYWGEMVECYIRGQP